MLKNIQDKEERTVFVSLLFGDSLAFSSFNKVLENMVIMKVVFISPSTKRHCVFRVGLAFNYVFI